MLMRVVAMSSDTRASAGQSELQRRTGQRETISVVSVKTEGFREKKGFKTTE